MTIVAHFPPYVPARLGEHYFSDVPAPVSGDNGKALTYRSSLNDFVFTSFEAAGAAASAMTAHLAAFDPHTQYLLDTQYTAADVLTKLLTVDGAGSGLDADLLDGNSSAAFLLATGATTGATAQAQEFVEGIRVSAGLIRIEDTAATGFEIRNASAPFDNALSVGSNGNPLFVSNWSVSANTQNDVTRPSWAIRCISNLADRFEIGRTPPGGGNTLTPMMRLSSLGAVTVFASDTGTNDKTNTVILTRTTTGAPAAGFATGFAVQLKSSTQTDRNAGRLTWEWVVATHATRNTRGKLTAYYVDTERECIAWEASSTVPLLGFLGAAPAARPSAYTQTYSTASRTVAAYTTDAENVAYTGIDNAQAGTVYAQLTDVNALRVAYENLRASHDGLLQVVNSIIDDIQAYGLFA